MPSSVSLKVPTIIRYLFYGGCLFALIWAVFVCGSFLLNPFEGFDGESEFVALSAQAAKRRLPAWPDGVSESEVESVSYKSSHSRDSYSSWYCVKLTNIVLVLNEMVLVLVIEDVAITSTITAFG